MSQHLHFDYTTVGHVTIDVLDDGSRRPGGTAFYSALQAARLGQRTAILTRGVALEIEELLAPYRDELQLIVMPAACTTTLRTHGRGSARSQSLLGWAGPIAEELELDTTILHLAPVARESPQRWRGQPAFVGLTPQGLARRWDAHGGPITPVPASPSAAAVAGRCDALVVNEAERACCEELIAAASAAGALVAVTAGEAPVTLLGGEGATQRLPVPALARPLDDLGAGDVFAAAFFITLSEGLAPAHAAGFATAAAAVRMQGAGADAVGERDAIQAHMRAGTAASG